MFLLNLAIRPRSGYGGGRNVAAAVLSCGSHCNIRHMVSFVNPFLNSWLVVGVVRDVPAIDAGRGWGRMSGRGSEYAARTRS